jgi:hypothetical protein
MGYIAEPTGINLTVINKGMSETEKKEMTKIIQKVKGKKKNSNLCFIKSH